MSLTSENVKVPHIKIALESKTKDSEKCILVTSDDDKTVSVKNLTVRKGLHESDFESVTTTWTKEEVVEFAREILRNFTPGKDVNGWDTWKPNIGK